MLRLFSSGHLAMFPIVVASGTIAGTAPVDGTKEPCFSWGAQIPPACTQLTVIAFVEMSEMLNTFGE